MTMARKIKANLNAGAGRSGHVFFVCREGDPDRLFALKKQRTDRPDVAPDANAREAALLRTGMKKSPRVMPELVEVGEWRGFPFRRRDMAESLFDNAARRILVQRAYRSTNHEEKNGHKQVVGGRLPGAGGRRCARRTV